MTPKVGHPRATLLLLLGLLIALLIVAANVYSYEAIKPINLAEVEKEKTINRLRYDREFFCGGFAPVLHHTTHLSIVYGAKACSIGDQELYEDIRVLINVSVGTWRLDNVAKLCVYTNEEVTLRITVEKHVEAGQALLLINTGSGVLTVDLSSRSESILRISKGPHVYTLSILLRVYESGTYIVRIGFYFEYP
jgi:hypothetical protein